MSEKDYLDVWVCDVETFKDCFTLVAANESKKKMYVFEISSRKDDSQRLRKFLGQLYKNKETMVGFNFVGFDYPVIVHFLENKGITCTELHELANDIIAAQNSEDDKFKYQVPKNKQWIRCVDLYLINHFNNKARATSLKMIEFNMRSPMIEDLPYNPTDDLTEEQTQKIVEYNKHDVLETLKFYKECLGAVKFRDVLSEQLGMDVTNFDDTKIGKQFFINELEKNDPEACYKNVGGRKIKRQTKRDSIDLSETILPYIKFKRPEFQAVKEWVAKQVITETKGVFTGIEEHELGELTKYAHMETKSKKLKTKETKDRDLYKQVRKRIREEDLDEGEVEQLEDSIYGVPEQAEIDELLELHPKGWVERTRLKSGKTSFNFKWRIAPSLNTVVDGFVWDFGVGGVHGATAGKSYVKDESQRIMSWDVTSYYPNLSIRNRIYPEHLGEMFCDVYEELFERRKKYPKGTPENLSMKLALNATYGASNDKYSVMLDPKFTMKITLAGQLSLAMLGEWLVEGCETLNIIMVNTDGLEFTVHPDEVEKSTQICQEWEKATKLQLEGEEYDKLFIANVNNYVGVFTDGKVKRKGAYEYEGLGWHQNQSALVIKRAAVLEMTDGIPLEKTIRDCRDPYDFMLRTKVPRSSRLVLRYHDSDGDLMREEQQQNITRYYIANDGGSLIKVMPPLPKYPEIKRKIGIDKEWLVKTCNNMKNFDWDINYDYYISEAKKLVNAVGEF